MLLDHADGWLEPAKGGIEGVDDTMMKRRRWRRLWVVPLGFLLLLSLLIAVGPALGLEDLSWLRQGGRQQAPESQLYLSNCASCHGPRGNRIPVAPLESPQYLAELGDPYLMNAIAKGKNSMPAFGRKYGGALEGEQIESIVSYLRSPERLAGASSTETQEARDLYVGTCARCHGLDGAKLPQASIGSEEYVNSRGQSSLTRIIKTGQGQMPAFASSLTDEQIETIVGYMRLLDSAPALVSWETRAGSGISVPHSVAGRSESCTTCHGPSGIQPYPAGHAGRADHTCLTCHTPVEESRPSPVPRMPHKATGKEECLVCHGATGLRPFPADHEGRANELCLQCHQSGTVTVGQLPRTPHEVDGRQDCLSCHKTGFMAATPADHAGRPQDKCVECHQPASGERTRPATQIRHDITRAQDCLQCHKVDATPASPAPTTPAQ